MNGNGNCGHHEILRGDDCIQNPENRLEIRLDIDKLHVPHCRLRRRLHQSA